MDPQARRRSRFFPSPCADSVISTRRRSDVDCVGTFGHTITQGLGTAVSHAEPGPVLLAPYGVDRRARLLQRGTVVAALELPQHRELEFSSLCPVSQSHDCVLLPHFHRDSRCLRSYNRLQTVLLLEPSRLPWDL